MGASCFLKSGKSAIYRNPELELAIGKVLHESLPSLKFCGKQLTEFDMPMIIDGLLSKSDFEDLNLEDDELNEKGVVLLAKALETNETLTRLRLEHNPIDSGIFSLATALHMNGTLRCLYLQSTNIGDDAAQALAEMLKNNRSLHILDLCNNQISSSGVGLLAEALHGASNSTLEELNLNQNPIDSDCVNDLIQMLKYNKVLQIFGLSYSEFPPVEKKKLHAAVRRKARI